MSGVYINENAFSKVNVAFPVTFDRIRAVLLTYTCQKSGDRIVLSDYDSTSVILRGSVNQNIDMSLTVLYIQYSISQANRTTLCNGVAYEVYGRLVIVHAYNITLSGDQRKVGTMPSGLCPRATVYGVINTESYAGIIYINSNGDVLFWARDKGDYTGQIVYLI